jgi:catalase
MLSPEEGIEVINARFGAHPGHRALHAKGNWCSGTFTATDAARALTRAAHLQGPPVPVLARLSNGGGNPNIPDYVPDVRGLAVSFELPDDSRTDLVAQSLPRFVSPTADDFLGLLKANTGKAAAWKMPAYLASHPKALASLPQNGPALKPPPSYGAIDYYTVHAYRWIAADGSARYTRATWISEQPAARLSPANAKKLGRDYLREDLEVALRGAGLRWGLEVQIAGDGDDVNDPSSRWPDNRERITVGTLHLTALAPDPEADGGIVVMDPTRVTDGIELSDDPVLHYRAKSYSASVARRAG